MGTDIFGDYIFFYLAALLIAVLKYAGFISWDWWMIGIPVYIALLLWITSIIIDRK